jgi:hypothetical protein
MTAWSSGGMTGDFTMRQLIASGAIAGATLFATLAIDTGTVAQAQKATFCANYDWSTVNCGFYTAAQCLATISGTGGWCTRGQNGPRVYGYVHGSETPDQPRRRRYRD